MDHLDANIHGNRAAPIQIIQRLPNAARQEEKLFNSHVEHLQARRRNSKGLWCQSNKQLTFWKELL